MKSLKYLLKSIKKYRLSSSLTLMSLVIAFLGIIVLSLYISYERSFDGFHKNKNDIYMMNFTIDMGGSLPVPMSKLIQDHVPEIEKAVIFVDDWYVPALWRPDQTDKDAVSGKIRQANADFFTMFDFQLLSGDAKTALSSPNQIVLSETMAQHIFGTTDVVGKEVQSLNRSMTVSGVMKDMPQNTNFYGDAISSMDIERKDDWSEWSYSLLFQLKKGTDPKLIEEKISENEKISQMLKSIRERPGGENTQVKLTPLDQIHYGVHTYMFTGVNKLMLQVLSILILILLIMGAINFINFSTSQAPLRAKSLSMQQIMGERKWKVRLQIIGEGVLLSLLALGIALLIHHFTYQRIENMFQIRGLSFEGRSLFYGGFVLLAILFGIVAGLYPSFYISSAPIAQAVKGKMFFSGKGKGIRSTLMVLQFVFSIALIAASFTIEKQLRFWNNFDIGIDKENVLYLPLSSKLSNSYDAFADELMKNTEIKNYCFTQFLPGHVGMGWGRRVDGQELQVKAWPVDDRFIDFFGIKMQQGRPFRQGDADINNFIVNEKTVQIYGWDKPLEKKFPGFNFIGDIVGVSQNFNFSSLKEEIEPMILWRTETRKNNILIKVQSGNYTQVKAYIEETAKKFDPDISSQVSFLDDSLEQLYSSETRIARFVEFVSLWSVTLALTGLLGLIVFISRDRIKEIGIRKVNGATIFEVMHLLNRNVIRWLLIAFVIATPIAYFAMSKWLQAFAYKTELSWWLFALSGALALLVALLTVSWQSWRAASRNPVEALRYE